VADVQPNRLDGAERRTAQRIQIRLPVEVGLPEASLDSAKLVFAELIDVGTDGCGAAVLISSSSNVMIGGRIDLLFEGGVGPIQGRVVSRMGLPQRWRLGIRIDADCAERLRAAVSG
jgi:hypothetical protein